MSMTPGSEAFSLSPAASVGQSGSWGRCGDSSVVPLPFPRFRSDLFPPQQPVEMSSSLGKGGEQVLWMQGCREARPGPWTSSERLKWGNLGFCALQCSLAGHRQRNRCPLTAGRSQQENCSGGRKQAPCHILSS